MITKDDVKNVAEVVLMPAQVEAVEKIGTDKFELENSNVSVKITKPGWFSPNEVRFMRIDLDNNMGDKAIWYVSYANTPKGKKHLDDRKRFNEAAADLITYNLMPDYFVADSSLENIVSKKLGQSVVGIISEGRLSEPAIACVISRLFGASKESIESVLGEDAYIQTEETNTEDKTYNLLTINDKTLADTIWTDKEENKNQLELSLRGLVKEAQEYYLCPALRLLNDNKIDNQHLKSELEDAVEAGNRLINGISKANISPYAPTIILPMDLAPENITIQLGLANKYKCSLIDQILTTERGTVRGSPLTIIRTYERMIPEHAFKCKEVFGKVLQVLKKEYYEKPGSIWLEYEPLIKLVTDYYHDARSVRRKAQEELFKLNSTHTNQINGNGEKSNPNHAQTKLADYHEDTEA